MTNTTDTDFSSMPDVQSSLDTRRIAIQRVGVKDVRYPLRVRIGEKEQATIGSWSMTVHLPQESKGTHMSRFIASLEKVCAPNAPALNLDGFRQMLRNMLADLDATAGRIELTFPYFIQKSAPISGVTSMMDYEVGLIGEMSEKGLTVMHMVRVPVTSLCPCSKEISDYGAHNQRSHITVNAVFAQDFTVEEFISKIESQASCELFGLLKRPDEKFVTERAYDNPKFVEDLVRDVAAMLNADDRILAYRLEAENFESIHNHSAYAMIESDKLGL